MKVFYKMIFHPMNNHFLKMVFFLKKGNVNKLILSYLVLHLSFHFCTPNTLLDFLISKHYSESHNEW